MTKGYPHKQPFNLKQPCHTKKNSWWQKFKK